MARRRVGAAVGLAPVSGVIVLIVLCARMRVCWRVCARVCARFLFVYERVCARLCASAGSAQFARFTAARI